MTIFSKGELWGNGSGSAAILNTGFALGQTIEVGRHDCLMRMRATIGGTAPSSVDLKIEYATPEEPSVFYELPLPEGGVFDGSDWVRDILFVPWFFYRISAKRTGGDATTSLYLFGTLRDNRIAEGSALTPASAAISWMRGVLGYLYDTVINALRVANTSGPETVLRGETLFDVTGLAIGTHTYHFEHDGFRSFALHYLKSGAGTATLKFYAAARDDGTAIGSRQYHDISQDIIGATQYTGTEEWFQDGLGLFRDAKSFKVEIVVTVAVVNVTGYLKQSY